LDFLLEHASSINGDAWAAAREPVAFVVVIAQLFGHDNLDIAAHYAQVSTRLMMQTCKASHPHARGPRCGQRIWTRLKPCITNMEVLAFSGLARAFLSMG
jgi:hypothetical protein